MTPLCYTVKEAARLVSMSPTVFRLYMKRKDVRSFNAGERQTKIDHAALMQFYHQYSTGKLKPLVIKRKK